MDKFKLILTNDEITLLRVACINMAKLSQVNETQMEQLIALSRKIENEKVVSD